jgi:hypothetical protein
MNPIKGFFLALLAAIFAPIAYLVTVLFGIGLYLVSYMVLFGILTGLAILFII